MAERRISYAPDVENGDHHRNAPDVNDISGLDEYTALNRYISTARSRRGSVASGDEGPKRKPWYKRLFATGPGNGVSAAKEKDTFVCPEEWIQTDIRRGLSAADIEPRRKKSGWNELTTEKTNMFIQFLGYFRGPILYGEFLPPTSGKGNRR